MRKLTDEELEFADCLLNLHKVRKLQGTKKALEKFGEVYRETVTLWEKASANVKNKTPTPTEEGLIQILGTQMKFISFIIGYLQRIEIEQEKELGSF